MDKKTKKSLLAMRTRCDSDSSREVFDRLCASPTIQKWVERHGDAADLPFAARQIEHVFTEIVRQVYAAQVFADQSDPLIPWSTDVPVGAKTFTYYLSDGTSDAVFLSVVGDGALPEPTLLGAEVTGRVEPFANAFSWTNDELRSAAFAKMPLSSEKADLAIQGHVTRLHRTAAWGREDLGLPGFLNHPEINVIDAPAGASTFTDWPNKTPLEVLADIDALLDSIPDGSNEVYSADTVGLPGPRLRLLQKLQLSNGLDGTGTTVMEFLQKTHPGVRWRAVNDLRAENSEGNLDGDAIIAFKFDKKRASLVVPLFTEQSPIQDLGVKHSVPVESTVGGVMLPHPLNVAIMHGI